MHDGGGGGGFAGGSGLAGDPHGGHAAGGHSAGDSGGGQSGSGHSGGDHSGSGHGSSGGGGPSGGGGFGPSGRRGPYPDPLDPRGPMGMPKIVSRAAARVGLGQQDQGVVAAGIFALSVLAIIIAFGIFFITGGH
jgi:hypothetical protein